MMLAAGHGLALAIFPLGAAVIAAIFGWMLLGRFLARRRVHEGIWAVALFMYAAASFAAFLGVIGGWDAAEYRVYWLLGAVLNVPYLFAGEVYLLSKRRALANSVLLALVIATGFAVWRVATATLDLRPLEGSLPLGKEAFRHDPVPYRLAQYYSLPAYFLLLGGLVWSAWQMRANAALRNRTAGTFGIALGATIVAIGSGIGAAFHVVPLFFVSLAAGVAVMFWGFLRASRPVRAATPAG
jgi:amino acid permease